MSSINYLIKTNDMIERNNLFNYLNKLGYKSNGCTRDDIINSTHPIAVNIEKKNFFIMDSAAIKFISDQTGNIIEFDKLKELIEKK